MTSGHVVRQSPITCNTFFPLNKCRQPCTPAPTMLLLKRFAPTSCRSVLLPRLTSTKIISGYYFGTFIKFNPSSCIFEFSGTSVHGEGFVYNLFSVDCLVSHDLIISWSEIWKCRSSRIVKGLWYSLQTCTYVVIFDKTFSLPSVWGQLMLPFISYGMKNEADRGSFLWEFSTWGPQKILSMGLYCSEDPRWAPL